MKQLIILFLILANTSAAFARGLSAKRNENETYQSLRQSFLIQNSNRQLPEGMKVELSKLDTSNVPEIADPELFLNSFAYLRDIRFMTNDSFIRRMTWLFPDDGCYARAELQAQLTRERNLPAPAKIYAFGNLRASTRNTPSGYVSWWYHVSIAYKHKGIVYVWDPAIEPRAPLTIEQWGQRMGSTRTRVEFALCNSKTFDPDHDCVNPTGVSRSSVLRDQAVFFKPEWSRLEYLGRNPVRELGDQPPWLAPLLLPQL